MEEVIVNKRRGRRPNNSSKRIQEVLEPENVYDINVSSIQDSADISVEQIVSNETFVKKEAEELSSASLCEGRNLLCLLLCICWQFS